MLALVEAVNTGEIPNSEIAVAAGGSVLITAGTYHPFTGPMNKQDGTVFLADGEVATDDQLRGMNFYLEGMVGDYPT